jgi:O-antigen/teichoic acid export membrane protein
MDKALEMGKSSATGSFHLLIGVAGSTIIMAIGTIILGIILKPSELGLYGMALIPASIINFFRDWGINSALTQQIASLRAAGKEAEIHDVIVSGVVFEVISGIVMSLVCFAIAWPVAWVLSPNDVGDLTIYISITSLMVFAGAIFAAASGIFVGFERMKLSSLSQILQAVVKTALGPLLIVLGFGVLGAIYAATISIVAGGVMAILIVYFSLFRPLRKCKVGKCDMKQTLKPMLKYGLPLTAAGIAIGVLPLVFSFTMATFAGTYMMGNYYAATYFSVLLTFISIPIATALFPIFAKLNPQKEPELVKTVFATSVKYTAFLLVPATLGLITLASPLINTIFPASGNIFQSFFVILPGTKYPYGPLFLAFSSLVNLLVLVGNISLGTFQTGIGKTNQVMKQSILSLVVGLPLAYLLVAYFYSIGGAYFAVIGGIVGALIATSPNVAWGLYWSWKNYNVKASFGASARILVSSLLASAAAFLFINFFNMRLPFGIILLGGFVIFLLVYLAAAPLFGAVNSTDIDNFRSMFSGLGFLSKVLNVPLLFMRKLCRNNNGKKALPEANSASVTSLKNPV